MDKYNVSGTNGTCLLASMGLQLNLTYERKDNTVGLGLAWERGVVQQGGASAPCAPRASPHVML